MKSRGFIDAEVVRGQDFDLPEVEEWLGEFRNFEKKPSAAMLGLERVRVMTEYFGRPERACRCLHVAGSKGKGTIVASVAAMLTAAGKRVGVYMSPHILHFTERVRSGEGAFDRNIYMRAFEELKKGVEEMVLRGELRREEVTWYELVTVFAMLVFREARVEWAVYEVGMGGRLDATNVILPEAVGMGVIELEHTEFLGDTVAKIAAEKAGVFKAGVPIYSVGQVKEARGVFAQKVREVGAEIEYVEGEDYLEEDMEVARTMVRRVCSEVSEEEMARGLAGVKLMGRYEKVELRGVGAGFDLDFGGVPYVLMDGAHTEESVRVVLERMKRDESLGLGEARRAVLVFACARDKRVEEMAREIVRSGLFERVFLTRPGEGKEADLPRAERAFREAMGELAEFREALEVEEDYEEMIGRAFAKAGELGVPVVVLGSFYLVGEVKKKLLI